MKKSRQPLATRREFLSRLTLAAGGAGLAASGLSACDPGEFMDYMLMEERAKVEERFQDSISGKGKQLVIPEPSSDWFSFLWVSDIHVKKGMPDYVDLLGAYADWVGADLILHSGDCVDRGEEPEYQKWVKRFDNYSPAPIFTALGNHDLYSDAWKRFLRYMGPSVYHFSYGPCDFIFIDTAAGTMGRKQMDWLEKTLSRCKQAHRFVFSHYPIYDGSFQTPSSMGCTEERMKLIHLFDKYDVTYFLCGHKHTGAHYKIRSTRHIISGAGSPYKVIVEDSQHFYRFDVQGASGLSKEKIYFDDLRYL